MHLKYYLLGLAGALAVTSEATPNVKDDDTIMGGVDPINYVDLVPSSFPLLSPHLVQRSENDDSGRSHRHKHKYKHAKQKHGENQKPEHHKGKAEHKVHKTGKHRKAKQHLKNAGEHHHEDTDHRAKHHGHHHKTSHHSHHSAMHDKDGPHSHHHKSHHHKDRPKEHHKDGDHSKKHHDKGEIHHGKPHSETPQRAKSQPGDAGTLPNNGLTGAAAPGTQYTGDFTWYVVGLGACGITSSPNDHVVAISEALFDEYDIENPNDNPLCGKSVILNSVDGLAYPPKVVDRCGGCATPDLDLSQDFFNLVTNNGDGRVPGMHWQFA